jgi:hypothetical protein
VKGYQLLGGGDTDVLNPTASGLAQRLPRYLALSRFMNYTTVRAFERLSITSVWLGLIKKSQDVEVCVDNYFPFLYACKMTNLHEHDQSEEADYE